MPSFKKPSSLAAKQPGPSPSAKLSDEDRPKRIAITAHTDETALPVLPIAPTIH